MKNIFIATALICSGFFGLYGQILNTTLYSTKDAYTISSSTANYGISSTMEAGIYEYRTLVNYRRSYLGFSLTDIPANAVITSANLKVYQTSGNTAGTSTDLYLERVTENWIETTIAKGTEPSTNSSDTVTSSSYASNWRSFNVINHVQKMVNGTYTNEGWLIRFHNETQTSGNIFVFHSRENTNDPKLEINYYVPLNVTSVVQNHCSTIVSADGSITPTFSNGCGSSYTYQWVNSAGATVGTGASLSSRAYGWYGLHAYNTANNDHLYMAFLLGVKCQNVAIEFNPGPDFIDDALLQTKTNGEWGDVNYGTNANFMSEVWSMSPNWYYRKSLLNFRLWVDTNISINTANLSLYGINHNSQYYTNPAELRIVNSKWNENIVSYNNAPSLGTTALTVPATTSATEIKVLNVKSFWDLWKANNTLNNGLMFQFTSYSHTYRRQHYHSSDATNSSVRPKINFNILVNKPVSGTVTASSSAICPGSTTTLTLSGYTSGATIQWQSSTNGTTYSNISGATSSSYVTLGSTIVDTYYRCVVTVGVCSPVNSNALMITIKPIPTVSVSNTTFCTGTNATLTATPSIGGGTYLWNTGATSSAIVVSPSTTTDYTVVYTLNGCSSSQGTGRVSVCGSSFIFVDSTELGQISVSVNEAPSKVGPYHYQISQFPIEDLSTVYHLINDSIYNGTLDSATFFLGSTTEPNFTYLDLHMGRYYVSVFDSRGVRIFDREVIVIPTIALSGNNGISITGNKLESGIDNASAAIDLYLNEQKNASLGFIIADKGNDQYLGLVNSSETQMNILGKYQYGFRVFGGFAKLIENGVEGEESIAVNIGSELILQRVDSLMEYYVDGVLIKSTTLPESLSYKGGVWTSKPGINLELLMDRLRKKKFYIQAKINGYYNCSGQIGGFNFITLNNFQTSVPFNWTVYKDGVPIGASTSSTYNAVHDFNPSSFGPGVYEIFTETIYQGNYYHASETVYLGVETTWTNLIKYDNIPNSYSVERNNIDPNTWSNTKSENRLVENEDGWIEFKPLHPNILFSYNVMRLSSYNMSSLEPVSLEVACLGFVRWGNTFIILWSGPNVGSQNVPLNSKILIKINSISNTIDLFSDITPICSFNKPSGNILLRAHSLTEGSGFADVITSFSCVVSNQYYILKDEVEQSIANVSGSKLKFKYLESYFDNSGELTYTIKCLNDDVIPTPIVVNKPLHTNWIEIPLGAGGIPLINGYTYLLEVIDTKGRKQYLKFKKA